MDYIPSERLDIEKIGELLKSYTKATGFVSALLDLEGEILTQSGWQDICTKFHRINPEIALNCHKSDTLLVSNLQLGNIYNIYTCLNGLVDIAVPIMVNGKHLYNLFTGQFLTEVPREDFFIAQAKKYNFDKREYMEVLKQVPVFTESLVLDKLLFLKQMTEMIIDLSLAKHEGVKMTKVLNESEEHFRSIIDQAGDAMYLSNLEGEIKMVNNLSCEMLGYSRAEFLNLNIGDLDVNYIDPNIRKEFWNKVELEQTQTLESIHKRKDGVEIPVEIRFSLVIFENNKAIVGFASDISERIKAEEKLHESEDKYRELVNLAQEGIWVIDKNNLTSFVNPSMAKMLGYASEEMLGKSLFDFMDEAGIKMANSALERRQAGMKDQHDFEFVCKNGDRVITSLETSPIIDKSGNYVGAIAGVMNITERKLAEEKLKDSEQTFRALFEKGPIGVAYHKMIYDETGEPINYLFLDANDSYQELTGVNPNGKLATEAFPGLENDPSNWIGTFGEVASTGKEIRFQQYLEPNDRWYDCVAYQYKPDHFVAAFLEITEQKKVEIALQETMAFNETLLNTSPDIIYIYDIVENKNIYSNNRIEDVLGYAFNEIQEMGSQMIPKLMHPDDLEKHIKETLPQYQLLKDHEFHIGEFRMKNKSGDWRWLLSKESIFLRDEEGHPIQVFGNLSDVTDQKVAEQELTKYRKNLEELVRERTENLEEKNNELKKFNDLFVDREFRIKELRDEIDELKTDEKN